MPAKKEEKKPVKITHIMKDGTVRDSVEGYIIPCNQQTKIIYQMLAGVKVV